MANRNITIVRTQPLLTALQVRLQGVLWTPAGGVSVIAFDSVALYDLKDAQTALKELQLVRTRVAWILYEGTQYESRTEGTHHQNRAIREFTILITERVLGDKEASEFGGQNNPGVNLLGNLVVEDLLAGPLPVPSSDAAGAAAPRCWIEVLAEQPVRLEGKERTELLGRSILVLSIRVHAGEALTELGFSRT